MILKFLCHLTVPCWTILFLSCAQIVPPSGGNRDTKPPQVVKYIPDSACTNFTGKNIAIVFDEFIQLNDLQKQLVISPPLLMPPEVKVKGKTLFIELKDSLKKNTTYSLNFGNAVRDFTEGNVKEGFQYVFSTGNYIDSLSLKGTVKNAFDMKPEKSILVMLYDSHNDSVPYKTLPSYFSKTNPDGSYTINNIRPGTYKTFALKDGNANYLYDLPTEQIGFSDTLVVIEKNTRLDFLLFTDEPAKQKLKKAYCAGPGHLVFAFTKPANSVKLQFLSQEPKQNVVCEYSQERDTLHYWFADDLKDTIKISINDGEHILDTIRIQPITKEQIKKNARGEKWTLIKNINVRKDKLFDLNKNMEILFHYPVASLKNEDKIVMIEDSSKCDSCGFFPLSMSSKGKIFLNGFFIRKTKQIKSRNYSIDNLETIEPAFFINWKENTLYHFFIPPGVFTDIFGNTNDTIRLDFKTQEEKYYGTLKLNLKMKYRIAYILQLINEKGELFDYVSSDKGIFTYNYLPPGSYKLRIIYDKNGDGKWTTGNYLQKRKPETVIYYPSPITIRSNWDMELDWKPE